MPPWRFECCFRTLPFASARFENVFQMSRNDLLVYECEAGMIVTFFFHLIVGTTDILIAGTAAGGSLQHAVSAILLCGGLVVVCAVQLALVRAFAGKSVWCVKRELFGV